MAITTTHSRMIGDLDAGSTYATTASLGTAAPLNVGTAANNVVQLDVTAKLPAVDGSQLTNVSGGIKQIVHGSNGAVATSTTLMINDDTIPQNNEGAEVVTVAITPTSATSKLFITSNIQMTKDSGTQAGFIALFKDSVADALAASWATSDTANNGNSHTLTHVMNAGTTTTITFKMRGGNVNSGTVTFNGESGGPKLGGKLFSTITVMEISA